MNVLQPMIDSGDIKVVVRPDRVRAGRHPALGPRHGAEAHGGHPRPRATPQDTVNGVLSPYDGLSLGIIAALKSNGYCGGGKQLPVVTGQDAEVAVGQVDHRG